MKSNFILICTIFLSLTACGQQEEREDIKEEINVNEEIEGNKERITEVTPSQLAFEHEVVIPEKGIIWGMDFLPDGSLLLTKKSGEILLYKDGQTQKLEGVPEIYLRGQGGLLDIAADPDYQSNGWIYFTFASSEGEGEGGNTALMRAKIKGNQLVEKDLLYEAEPNSTAGQHFGSRIAFDEEGHIYFTIGDRANRQEDPQDLSRDGGKVYRLNRDGSIPDSNPFTEKENAIDAIFSYGHRNPQSMAMNPETGEIWLTEHGPQGGDEINVVKKGENYGWPLYTYGINYDGTPITEETSAPGITDPLYYWVPSIAPSGMLFVTSPKYPELQGDLLVGSLKFQYLEHLTIEGKDVVKREKLLENIGRVRDVIQTPDGLIYVSVEGTGIVKLIPVQK